MRLFVAVELPEPVVAAAAGIAAALRRRVIEQAPRARLTWVPPERMHLTIRFLGDVSPEEGARVTACLAAPLATPVFETALGTVGTFPQTGPPRVIWIGFSAGQDGLVQLEREVTSRLDSAGVSPEARPFRPHLTLARVRDAAGLRSAPLVTRVDVPAATGEVRTITLFESRLSPQGPTYTALQHTPLRQD